jgi:hypothetical protein
MATSSSFIFFYNGNNNSKSFRKLQGYFKFIWNEVIHSYIVSFIGFIIEVQTLSKELTSPRIKNLKKTNLFLIGHIARDGFKVRKVYQNQSLMTRMIMKNWTSSQKIVHLCLICYHLIVKLFSSFCFVLSSSLCFISSSSFPWVVKDCA